MIGKIILNLAISLDGYIADESGGFDWIVGQDDQSSDTDEKYIYNDFLKGVDVVVMGKNCYDQGFAKDFKDKKVYVATNIIKEDEKKISFVKDIVEKVLEEKSEGENIFLFGGGDLVDNFLKSDTIDEFIIGIIPVILGKGKSLFLGNNPKINLHLEKYYIHDGVAIMSYKRR